MRVLIVDDSPIIRFELSDILEGLGFEIVGEAEDGEQAVLKYKELMPDVVTLDIVMPNKDGYYALKEIKNLNPNANVIMVTALSSKQVLKECLAAGAFDFIEKPFVKDKIIQVFQRFEKYWK